MVMRHMLYRYATSLLLLLSQCCPYNNLTPDREILNYRLFFLTPKRTSIICFGSKSYKLQSISMHIFAHLRTSSHIFAHCRTSFHIVAHLRNFFLNFEVIKCPSTKKKTCTKNLLLKEEGGKEKRYESKYGHIRTRDKIITQKIFLGDTFWQYRHRLSLTKINWLPSK